MLRNKTHTGPVRGLDFNPIQSHLFASGAVNGEVRPIPAAYIHEAESHPSRFTSGILRIQPSPILLETVVQNLTKLPQSPGIITCNMFSLPQVAPDILLCGICGASEKSPVLCMGEELGLLGDLQATMLADWVLAGGEV